MACDQLRGDVGVFAAVLIDIDLDATGRPFRVSAGRIAFPEKISIFSGINLLSLTPHLNPLISPPDHHHSVARQPQRPAQQQALPSLHRRVKHKVVASDRHRRRGTATIMSGPSNGASSSSSSSSSDSRWSRWGKTAFDKSIVVSDWASGYANAASAKMGGERFWPKSNDFPEEITKCERILRAFTVEGIETKPSSSSSASADDDVVVEKDPKKEGFIHKKRKVLRKIPPSVIKRAKGIVIYTAMRSGIAPFGGAGGAGLMLARLPDGSWSAPSSISPNNLAVGLLLGFDIFDVILVVNSDRAMETFKSHKVTLGAETAVAAGPFGAGISGEMGIDRSPVFSYVRSRGLYGGVEAMAQAFLHRFDENERIYYWPGITARDILEGKVRKPPIVDPLYAR